MAFNVNQLTDYVEQNRSELISATILSPRSIDDFTPMAGVHSPTTLNLFSNGLVFQNGAACGFNPQGDTTFSQRVIEPGIIKINMEWCDKDLVSKYTTHQVMIGANRTELPFEAKITDDLVKQVSDELEKLVWQGDKASGTGNMAFTNGICKLVDDAGALCNVVTFAETDTIVDKVNKVYMAIPEKVLNDTVIYMSPANFRAYCMAQTAINLYNYTTDVTTAREVIIPGTETKIKLAMGLSGVDKIYAFVPSQMVYGFDASEDWSDFKLWFSDDNDTFRLKISFAAGVQFAFPQYITVGKN